MRFYADLHIHSKYSRATSKNCDLEHLAYWGRKKGITVIGTGDFTHPAWINEIKNKLVPAEPGLFRLRDDLDRETCKGLPPSCRGTTRFMLSVEISTIYKKGDKTRKIHHLIYVPSIEKAERISQKLATIGNIRSDGRPILGLDSRHLLEIVIETGEDCYLVPAHIWTPWFAVLGSKSGFDSITECYGDLAHHIFALETGLSSDPEMNWRISQLDRFRLVSNSDAHSPGKLGREACMFDTDLDYYAMRHALETGEGYGGTVEFFPEEGKYHLDGHRKCGVRLSPEESRAHNGLCPVCKKPLTLGVMYRVEELADRHHSERPDYVDDFVSLVPLPEMISETVGTGPTSKKVALEYEDLLYKLGSELNILNDIPLDEIQRLASSSLIPEAISRMRQGQVIREPGFDGEYGRIRLFEDQELRRNFNGLLFDFAEAENSPQVTTEGGHQKKSNKLPATKEDQAHKEQKKPRAQQALKGPQRSESNDDPVVNLDLQQQQAVEIIEGPLLIIAGPGSGKTRVLTHRVAHLIAEHQVKPSQCLAITFTRRAAEEMRQRLQMLLPEQWDQVPVMTFHALGFKILMQNRVTASLPRGFRIASEGERRTLLMASLDLSDRKAKKVLQEISQLKRKSQQPQSESVVAKAWSLLTQQTETRGWLDYDDLMILAVGLLENDMGLRAVYQQRYPWVSIDEYQDIDEQQYRLLRLLVPDNGNICAIGDPDQAIYRFRGADVGYFLRFEQDFPSAQKIQLIRNYRSGQSILYASTQMISPSTLVEDRQVQALMDDTGKVTIHSSPTDKAEAEFVVHTIEQMMGGVSFFSLDSQRSDGERQSDYGFSDFAVLYRTEAQADVIEAAFSRSGIPFQRHGHNSLSDHPHVQVLLRIMQGSDTLTVLERLREAQAEVRFAEEGDPILDGVVEKLQSLAEQCEDRWQEFLSELHLNQEIDIWDERADRCSLLTLHAAKGLEFSVVFIAGCEDGLLPLKWGANLHADELAEERRLFYVGMTRAKERLFLSHAQKRFHQGKTRPQKLSPFLKDIEEQLLERSKHTYSKKRFTKKDLQLDLF